MADDGPVRDLLLDEDGDLAVADGDLQFAAGRAAVQQGIAVRVRMFAGDPIEGQPDKLDGGDCWLDQEQGIPWRSQILTKGANPLVARELIREAIADTPDVVRVVGSKLVDVGNRESRVDFVVQDIYSNEPLSDSVDLQVVP